MSLVKEQLGDPAIREMYDVVLLPLFAWRYEKFDIDKHPWDQALETLMLVACEAMRGHLVGPERTGDMELIETRGPVHPALRPVRLRPAHHPGRLDRGHAAPHGAALQLDRDRGARHLDPRREGRLPLLRALHRAHGGDADRPLRLPGPRHRPAAYPDTNSDPMVRQKCQWQMFKDPTTVPEEYYTRVGRTKPAQFGSRAHGAKELPVINVGMPGAG